VCDRRDCIQYSRPVPADQQRKGVSSDWCCSIAARDKLPHRGTQELLIAFGAGKEGGDVGKKVRETLIQLEAELGIWKEGVKTAWKEQVVDRPKR
jgi:hypothetical protein